MAATDNSPPDTLLGQLQRGLGRGYLAVLRARRGADELLACIAEDPRWDRQVEERAAFYAKLALELEVPVAPIATAMAGGEDGYLAADVLAEMAVRGRGDALTALRGGLRESDWLTALEALDRAEQEYGEALVRPEDLSSVAAREPGELRNAISNSGLPWRRWAAGEPRLRGLLEEANMARDPGPPAATRHPDTAMSTAELLSIAEPRNGMKVAGVLSDRRDAESIAALVDAAQGDDRNQRLAAYRALGAQGNTDLLEHVASRLEADPGGPSHGAARPPMLRYLESLPAELTLPLARAWVGQSTGAASAAQHILARHALPEDRDLVERTLNAALDQGTIYEACSMVEALEAIADPRSAPLLISVFERIQYSWGRPRVLRALVAAGAESVTELAHEALWDCEEEARELGAQHSADTASARSRLAEMAEDRFERERVCTAARTRLRKQG